MKNWNEIKIVVYSISFFHQYGTLLFGWSYSFFKTINLIFLFCFVTWVPVAFFLLTTLVCHYVVRYFLMFGLSCLFLFRIYCTVYFVFDVFQSYSTTHWLPLGLFTATCLLSWSAWHGISFRTPYNIPRENNIPPPMATSLVRHHMVGRDILQLQHIRRQRHGVGLQFPITWWWWWWGWFWWW